MKHDIRSYAMALPLSWAVASPCLSLDGSRNGAPQPPLEPADFTISSSNDRLDLFLLVGQSNMKGRGSVNMKPETDKRILFFHLNKQAWFVALRRFSASLHRCVSCQTTRGRPR